MVHYFLFITFSGTYIFRSHSCCLIQQLYMSPKNNYASPDAYMYSAGYAAAAAAAASAAAAAAFGFRAVSLKILSGFNPN